MKPSSIIVLACIVLLTVTSAVYAQKYDIQLRSRTWMPSENAVEFINKRPSVSMLTEGKMHVLVQFNNIPDENIREELRKSGLQLHDYVSGYAYQATLDNKFSVSNVARFGIRHISLFQVGDKVEQNLLDRKQGLLNGDPKKVYVYVLFYPDVPIETVSKKLNKEYGVEIKVSSDNFKVLSAVFNQSLIEEIAAKEWVAWMEPVSEFRERNDGSRALIKMNEVQNAPYNLSGSGIRLALWDGGKVYAHNGFTGRLTYKTNYSVSYHGTHVAGTMAGTGAGSSNNYLKGMSPGAEIYNWSYLYDNGTIKDWTQVAQEMINGVDNDGIMLSQNSWGDNGGGNLYTIGSRMMDQVVRQRDIPVVFAIGYGGHGYNSMWSPETGKDLIAVTATTKTGGEYTPPSSGPCVDGRLRPDIAAAGVNINSTGTSSPTSYVSLTGTSMAAPAVSGAIGAIMERYMDRCGVNTAPSAALIKAILLNTATDIGNPGPDFFYGYGLVNAQDAVRSVDGGMYKTASISQGGTNNVTLEIPSGLSSVRVMLAYTDPEAAVNANPALINNLDLKLISPSSTEYLPLTLNPGSPSANATPGVNNRDNVEQVVLTNPTAGSWVIRVSAPTVPSGPQSYAISWIFSSTTLAVTMPNYWSMASVPDMVFDFTKTAVWANANYDALSFNGSGYVAQSTLSNGAGYWIRYPSSQNVDYVGVPMYAYCVPVSTGWNMFGSLSKSFTTSQITTSPSNIVISNYFGYSSGYFVTDNIDPAKGYWVKVNQDGYLILDAYAGSGGSTRICVPPPPSPNGEPAPPILSSPYDGATGVSRTPTLSWNASGGATSYRLEVSTNSTTFSPLTYGQSGLTGTSQQISGLGYSTTYYWRVNATNANGTSLWSCVWQFTTQAAPPPCQCCAQSTATLDNFTVTDAKGNSQQLFTVNGGRTLKLKFTDFDAPPIPPKGMFNVRFRSGKFMEKIAPNQGTQVFNLDVRDAQYPVTLSWNFNRENNATYYLIVPGVKTARIPIKEKGDWTFEKLPGNTITIESQSSTPCPPEQKTVMGDVAEIEMQKPDIYLLAQNTPNPFNPQTIIMYQLPFDSRVTLTVFDVLGKEVAVLVNGEQSAGYKSVAFNALGLPSGVYFYRISAVSISGEGQTFTQVKKMLLAK